MTTWAIGDLQGCLAPLHKLLDKIKFDPQHDQLWFTGDLINRGPQSLETLKFVMDLGDAAITVLGNHDLHFLAVAAGHDRNNPRDTFDELLAAPDLQDMVDWLRSRPLFHFDKKRNMALLHAGLPPQWKIKNAVAYAREVEHFLQGDHYTELLINMYGNSPRKWDSMLVDIDRYRFIINCFTRMRYCTSKGKLDFKYKCKLGKQPSDLHPWFSLDKRKSHDTTILFGHWSTLGFFHEHNVVGLDSGCLWGGKLSAVNIDKDFKLKQVKCKGNLTPDIS